jgi:predicted porin
MKKSIVALAVSSAALASVSAYAAEDTSVDFYGNIQYAFSNSNVSGKGSNFEDNGSTVGIKGESKVTDDLTAFFKYELEFKADEQEDRTDSDAGTNGTDYNESKLDQAYVGLKGSFGKVTVGTHDTIYNNAIQDAVDQFEYLGIKSAKGSSQGDTITYFSPSMSGFEVQVAIQTKGTDPDATSNGDNSGNAPMAVLKYSNDLVSVALGYDSRDNTAASDTKSTSGLAVTVTPMDNLSITAKYETTEDYADFLGLAARYGYGMGDVYGSYTNVNVDDSQTNHETYNQYAVGVTYSINSSMYTYAEIGSYGSDTKDVGSSAKSAVGVTYVF